MITIKRFAYHPQGTLGVMQVPANNVHQFYTIERPWLDNKPFESWNPLGEYTLKWQESLKFDWCYEVENVEGRTHILLHVANYPTDVVGCIGLGLSLMGDRIAVGNSRAAMAAFHDVTGGKPWQLRIANAPYAALPNQ